MPAAEPVRVAALYDVHGNLPALEAVLEEVRRAAVDELVVGGDVFPGPMSGEALDLLLDIEPPVRFVRGNGERWVLALAAGEEPDGIPEQNREALRWVARQLTPEHRREIASWPEAVRLEIDGLGGVLFCHATPRHATTSRSSPAAPRKSACSRSSRGHPLQPRRGGRADPYHRLSRGRRLRGQQRSAPALRARDAGAVRRGRAEVT